MQHAATVSSWHRHRERRRAHRAHRALAEMPQAPRPFVAAAPAPGHSRSVALSPHSLISLSHTYLLYLLFHSTTNSQSLIYAILYIFFDHFVRINAFFI